MANSTPEQRKEAAECLRENIVRIYDWVSDYDIAAMVGIENYTGDKGSTDELLERLADLIDPICTGIDEGRYLYGTDCPALTCSACGGEFDRGSEYCSCCGARIKQ